MRALLMAAALLLPCAASAEAITFEVYELQNGGGRQLLASGTKTYVVEDIESGRSSKELPLTDRFAVGASVHRHKELIGFGLWAKQRTRWFELWKDDGFSWDWFNREQGPMYRKLQGPGRVKATITKTRDYEELTSVEFLDDITLRLNARPWFFFSDGDTHHVVVRRGSILKLAP